MPTTTTTMTMTMMSGRRARWSCRAQRRGPSRARVPMATTKGIACRVLLRQTKNAMDGVDGGSKRYDVIMKRERVIEKGVNKESDSNVTGQDNTRRTDIVKQTHKTSGECGSTPTGTATGTTTGTAMEQQRYRLCRFPRAPRPLPIAPRTFQHRCQRRHCYCH